MRRILKHPIGTNGNAFRFSAFSDSVFMHVAAQRGEICLWSDSDVHSGEAEWMAIGIATGSAIDDFIGRNRSHVGTLLFNGGELVMHYYVERLGL